VSLDLLQSNISIILDHMLDLKEENSKEQEEEEDQEDIEHNIINYVKILI
jgi:hypothetical protein